MSEHTPTPWYAGGGSMDFGNYIIQTHKGAIAHVHPPNAQANVEFIIRACNSHEELLEALKEFLEWAEKGGPLYPREHMEQAVAKAEGRV